MKYLLSLIVIALLVVGGVFLWKNKQTAPVATDGQVACTMDAKICPDGTAVGRIAPNCEFAACPNQTTSAPMPAPGYENSGIPEMIVEGEGEIGVNISQVHFVRYTATGFSPKTLSIKKGDTVTFTNETQNSMSVASDPHPTHTDLSGFDQKGQLGAYSYTFTTTGTWGYHNHRNASHTGTIVVQ